MVRPSYHNWAPWIGPHTISGNLLLNTEYEKVHSPYSAKDIGVAWYWVQSHCELFHGEVMEPGFLQMDEEKQSNIIKDYLKGETEKARDACVFVFDNREDMETFLLKCVDEH